NQTGSIRMAVSRDAEILCAIPVGQSCDNVVPFGSARRVDAGNGSECGIPACACSVFSRKSDELLMQKVSCGRRTAIHHISAIDLDLVGCGPRCVDLDPGALEAHGPAFIDAGVSGKDLVGRHVDGRAITLTPVLRHKVRSGVVSPVDVCQPVLLAAEYPQAAVRMASERVGIPL